MSNVSLEILNNEKANLVKPNFTRNRFDLVSKKNYSVLKYVFEENTYFIPIRKNKRTLELGIYLVQLNQLEFETLIKEVFKAFKNINRIKIAGSINNYSENSKTSDAIDYVTVLPDDEETYYGNFSSKFRYNRKREWKIINSNFENVEIKKYSKDIPDELFKEYFKFKKITHKKNYRMTPQKYIKKYLVSDAYELKLNGKTEAIVLISDIENNIYVENVTYNTQLGKYNLGILLLLEMIKDCIKNDKTAIYWGTNNDYKKHFATSSITTYSGYIYKNKAGLFWKNFFNAFKKH